MYQNYQKNTDFGLFRQFPSSDFFTIGFIVSAYPLKAKKIIKVFWSPPSNQLKTSFWCLKTRISWTSRRATFMRLKYLESGDLFTSNGLFKIRNKFSRKKFPKFPQFLAKSSCQPYPWYNPHLWVSLQERWCRENKGHDGNWRWPKEKICFENMISILPVISYGNHISWKVTGFQKNHASALQRPVMVKGPKIELGHAQSNLTTTKKHWKRFRPALALYQLVTSQWLNQLKFLWTTWLQLFHRVLTVQNLFSGRFSPIIW